MDFLFGLGRPFLAFWLFINVIIIMSINVQSWTHTDANHLDKTTKKLVFPLKDLDTWSAKLDQKSLQMTTPNLWELEVLMVSSNNYQATPSVRYCKDSITSWV